MTDTLRSFVREGLAVKIYTVQSRHSTTGKENSIGERRLHLRALQRACGATDTETDFESGDCRLEYWQARRQSFYSHVFGEGNKTKLSTHTQKNLRN